MTTKNFRKIIDRVFIGLLVAGIIAVGYIMLDNARFSTFEEYEVYGESIGYMETVRNGFGEIVDIEIHTVKELAGL